MQTTFNQSPNNSQKFLIEKKQCLSLLIEDIIMFFTKMMVKFCRSFDENAFHAPTKKKVDGGATYDQYTSDNYQSISIIIERKICTPDAISHLNETKKYVKEYNKTGNYYMNRFRMEEFNELVIDKANKSEFQLPFN